LCGFAFGAWALQLQAKLPDANAWRLLILVGCAASFVFLFGRYKVKQSRQKPDDSIIDSAYDGHGGSNQSQRGKRCWRLAVWLTLLGIGSTTGFGWAAWRAEQRLARALPEEWQQRDIQVTGTIASLPTSDPRSTRFLFDVDSNDANLPGFPRRLQLAWYAEKAQPATYILPGQRWNLMVRLKRPHGNANWRGFDAEAVALQRNLRAAGYVREPDRARLLGDPEPGITVWLLQWRDRLQRRIHQVLPDQEHVGIVVALAIGLQSGISEADWTRFRRTGTNHLVAISGLHVGLVAGFAGWFAAFLWRRSMWCGQAWPLLIPAHSVAAGVAAIVGGIYAGLAGFGIPAQRALWMLIVAAIAFGSGRALAKSNILAWALALVILVDPWAPISAGFWLSFGAVAVIVATLATRFEESPDLATLDSQNGRWSPTDKTLSAPTRQPRIAGFRVGLEENGEEPQFGRGPGGGTRAAGRQRLAHFLDALKGAARIQWTLTISLVPLTLLWFSQVSLVAPLANAVAIPWVSFLVTPAVLAGVILPAPFDALAFSSAHYLVNLLTEVFDWLAAPGWAVWKAAAPTPLAIGLAMIGLAWWLMPRGWPLRQAVPLTWLPLLWPAPDQPPQGEFKLTVLDVGQGASALIETRNHRLLFDAGPGPEAGDAGRRIVLPYLRSHGIDRLDAMVISHAHADHAGGAKAVIENVSVDRFIASMPAGNSLWRVASSRGAARSQCRDGMNWIWDGVRFEMLWPRGAARDADANATSCVLRIAGTGYSALLTGDLTLPGEQSVIASRRAQRRPLHADVLLAPHHGSATSSSLAFLRAVNPVQAVFQVGNLNQYRHPNRVVAKRYLARGISTSRTDQDGAVRFETRTDDWSGVATRRYRTARVRYWSGR
jgi:competence protein ComEC